MCRTKRAAVRKGCKAKAGQRAAQTNLIISDSSIDRGRFTRQVRRVELKVRRPCSIKPRTSRADNPLTPKIRNQCPARRHAPALPRAPRLPAPRRRLASFLAPTRRVAANRPRRSAPLLPAARAAGCRAYRDAVSAQLSCGVCGRKPAGNGPIPAGTIASGRSSHACKAGNPSPPGMACSGPPSGMLTKTRSIP